MRLATMPSMSSTTAWANSASPCASSDFTS
jgi:hypothetical protein